MEGNNRKAKIRDMPVLGTVIVFSNENKDPTF